MKSKLLIFLLCLSWIRLNSLEIKSGDEPVTMLVSTLDGYLTAVDSNTGREKWRYKEGPIVEGPQKVRQDFSFIPNPRSGELYLVAGQHLSKLPFTIPQLVKTSPCKSSDGILYAGSKKDVWIAMNPESGVHEETVPPQNENSCPVGNPETIFIGRTEYKITMIDTKKKEKQWNATFIDYSSHLLPVDHRYPYQHFHSVADGRLITMDLNSRKIKWKKNFKSVVVNLYFLKSDGMHRIPSTSVGKATCDTLQENTASFIFPEWSENYLQEGRDKTITQPQTLSQTLYIGESAGGLYALNAFVDQKADSYAISRARIDGPKIDTDHVVGDSEALDDPVYVDETFLMIGHHEVPPLLLNNLITTETEHNRLPWITYVKGREEVKDRIGGSGSVTPNHSHTLALGHNEEDFDWSHLFQQAWKKNPYVVTLFLGGIVMVLLYAAFLYGQQRITNQILSSRGEIHSGGSSTRNTLSAPGALDDEGSANGPKEIGKLSFDSRKILGMGCAGTTVFKGTFDGREVAVKRVLTSQFKLVERELELLKKSDAHKNVIRYFCSERDDNFHYIALELCECTLSDYVKLKDRRQKYTSDVLDILKQATEGVSHLHSIAIVHRDLKPQNILLSSLNNKGHVRVKISDFGLCKQVKLGHASISKVSGLVGTEGWIAPEAINQDNSSVTYSVDVFSLGCIFYYVLSEGKHPFGERNDVRHANIYSGKFNLEHLVAKEDYVAMNAIEKMVEMEAKKRPTSHAVLCHPIFWSKERQLRFFSDVSDRIEKEDEASEIVRCLEMNSYRVVSNNWNAKLSFSVQQDLRNHRSYKGHSIKDLLRAIRNKKNHYQELPVEVRREYGSIPDEYMTYFTTRFPYLLIHVFKVAALCADESAFVSYYPLESRSFCGRVLQEQLLDEFCLQGSPKRTVLSKTSSPPGLTTILPSNWRNADMRTQSVRLPQVMPAPSTTIAPTIIAPEGKNRRRRRKKPTLMALASTLEGDIDDTGDADILQD